MIQLSFFLLATVQLSLTFHIHEAEERIVIPHCPNGGEVMRNSRGDARRCLPHQTNICIRALPKFDPTQESPPNPDAVCCWYNQVDYYCCSNVERSICPDYKNITVVIHKGVPQQNGPRLLAFRKTIRQPPRLGLQGPTFTGAAAFPPGFQGPSFGGLPEFQNLGFENGAVQSSFPGFEVPSSFPGFELASQGFQGFPGFPSDPRVLSTRVISSFNPTLLNPARSQRRLVLSQAQRRNLAAARRFRKRNV